MSVEQKQQLGMVVTWGLRLLTAIGGFFLIQTYGLLKENNALLQRHLIQYASESKAIEIRIGVAEKELERYRNERESRTHYWDQYRNEQPQTP